MNLGARINEAIEYCEWFPSKFLFISENVFSALIYYSHLLPTVICVVLAVFLFIRVRDQLSGRILIFLCFLFALWSIFDLITWASESPQLIMFFWTSLIILEPIIFFASLYFILVFIRDRDIDLKEKLILGILITPTIILIPTQYAIESFSLLNCEREVIEGPLVYYGYIIEIILVLWAALAGLRGTIKAKTSSRRWQIALLTLGTLLFLLAFSWGNIAGSLTEDWSIGQYGLLGMPIFIGFLVYVMVTYRAFHARMFGTQALVATLWLLLLGILFVRTIENVRIITSITLILLLIVGVLLVRSVRREIEQREKIEKLAEDLKIANEGQTNLIHIINHQVKGYIAKGRNIFAELSVDGYGKMPEASQPLLKEGLNSLTEAVAFVQQILTASNVERGTMTYTMKPFDFKTVASEVVEKQKITAEQKGLEFNFEVGEGDYTLNGDEAQLKEAARNLIDNSINYTLKGSVKINLEKSGSNILLTVRDTGVGISEEDMKRLFTKGGRGKDSLKINVNSTGYGLSFVKGVVTAHKGRVWAQSEGPGKGSVFFMELPTSQA